MRGILKCIKREPTLVIAAAAAIVSCCFVPPDAAYSGYVDFRTLALLYALMLVVAGLRKAGPSPTWPICSSPGRRRPGAWGCFWWP